MEVFEGVFAKRGDGEASACSSTGVFEEVFVRRGRWRKPAEAGSKKSENAAAVHADIDQSLDSQVILTLPTKKSLQQPQHPPQFDVKNTFVNTAVLDFDSLQEFLKERKVKSCPASRQVSSVTMLFEDVGGAEEVSTNAESGSAEDGSTNESGTEDEALNTASSFGGMLHISSPVRDAEFKTSSTLMDTRFETLQHHILAEANESDPAARPALKLSRLVPSDQDIEEPMPLDSEIAAADDRLLSLRMRGSAIQEQLSWSACADVPPAPGLTTEASSSQQLPNQWLVAVNTPDGVVPGVVTLLGGVQQPTQIPAAPLSTPRTFGIPSNPPPVAAPVLPPSIADPVMPPPAAAAPVLRLADAIAAPELGTAELPSIGSLLHHKGECKPCTFFHTRGCDNKQDCQFCHLCGPGEKKKRIKAQKAAQREATFVALERAKATLACFRVAQEQGIHIDTIVE